MEEEVSFPDEVMELILRRLPTLSLNRFRVVCKRWQSIISSEHLRAEEFGPAPTEKWMLVIPEDTSHGDVIHAFIPRRAKWHTIYLPKSIASVHRFIDATGGHLICMSDRGHLRGRPTRVVVCNPLMRTWQELPALQDFVQIRSMGVNPETKAFKILATPSGMDPQTYTAIYDSDLNGWRTVTTPVLPLLLPSSQGGNSNPPIYLNSCFYFIGQDFNLYGLNTHTLGWVEVRTSSLFLGIGVTCEDTKLIESDGKIILFTAEVDLYGKRDYTIWRLTAGNKWERATRPPWSISSKFLNTCRTFSVWASQSGKSIYLKNVLCPRVAHVDLLKQGDGEWRWIPDNALLPKSVLKAMWV